MLPCDHSVTQLLLFKINERYPSVTTVTKNYNIYDKEKVTPTLSLSYSKTGKLGNMVTLEPMLSETLKVTHGNRGLTHG